MAVARASYECTTTLDQGEGTSLAYLDRMEWICSPLWTSLSLIPRWVARWTVLDSLHTNATVVECHSHRQEYHGTTASLMLDIIL